jgi:antitoxin CptB
MKADNNKNFINPFARLEWACRRGMLELDVLLGNFLKNRYPALPEAKKKLFVELLTYSDPELFSWLLGRDKPKKRGLLKMTEEIRQHAQS